MENIKKTDVDLVDVFGPHEYDATCKSLTADCKGCKFFRIIIGEERCYHGKAYKLLNPNLLTFSKKCASLRRPSPREMELKRCASFSMMYEIQRPKM